MRQVAALAVAALLVLGACGGAPRGSSGGGGGGGVQKGTATWYGAELHGRRTASGEPFDMNALTAAHRTLPFGAIVRVTNVANGRSVVVRINDRGPYGGKGRVIDLSRAAAKALRMLEAGVAEVELRVLELPPSRRRGRP